MHYRPGAEGGSRVDVSQLVALAIGVFGIGGLVFTALRYNRDDTTAIVNQQAQITAEMETLERRAADARSSGCARNATRCC